MAELTLANIFTNTIEDATTITLTKADLGITLATTTADQFLAAIFFGCASQMTREQYELEYEQKTYIADLATNKFTQVENKNDNGTDVEHRNDQFNIHFTKVTGQGAYSPTDY